MPEISRFFGIIITMYFTEHNPPHFYARYGEHKAEVAIQTLSVIAGRLPLPGCSDSLWNGPPYTATS